MSKVKCSRTDCVSDKTADWCPVLVLRAPRQFGNVPIKIQYGLRICFDCRDKMTVDSLVTDQSWEMLSTSITNQGKIAPDRSRTLIETILWEGSMLQRVQSARTN